MFLFEKALVGSRRYKIWVGALLAYITLAFVVYLYQLNQGLGITGMSRNVSWGLYIGQFTFLVGVAASAVMVVLPYYLHNRKEFGRMTILGESLAVAAVTMCLMFIMIDMGKPMRALNVLLYPQFHSIMFWDMVSLGGYLILNAVITVNALHAEQQDLPLPRWLMPIILLSIPWAISIHTVTGFLYAGLPGRLSWRTAIMAPRFLASAFAAGPALLILLSLLLRKLTRYDVGKRAINGLAVIVTYAMVINTFFILMEFFTAMYSRVPGLTEDFQDIYLGQLVHTSLLPWGRTSLVLMAAALIMLLIPKIRRNERTLAIACGLVFLSLWIDKGFCMVVGGFIPSPLGTITRYVPTLPEIAITVGVWAVGALMITVFYKIALAVNAGEEEPAHAPIAEVAHSVTAIGSAAQASSTSLHPGLMPSGPDGRGAAGKDEQSWHR
jgi:molybdopterin-containing oxidoreductase family membrane subunit